MVYLSYAQLEGYWIHAGGNPALAPVMAAIALAESGTDVNGQWLANSDALNPDDDNGRQSSYGAWQISNGTHLPPAANWNDPAVNAQLAVQKERSQGLPAWGTYNTGAYRKYLNTTIQAQDTGIHLPADLNPLHWIFGGNPFSSLTGPGLPAIGGGISSAEHILSDVGSGAWWKRIGKGAVGAGLILGGVYFVMKESGIDPVKDAKKTAVTVPK